MTTEKTETQDVKQAEKPPVKDKKYASPVVPVQPSQSAEREQLIYIGPNLPGGRLARSFISLGGFPEYLNDLAEQVPEIRDLFIPVTELSAANAALRVPGSNQHIAYAAVVEAIRKGGI
ncbi:hypothetical protein C1I60_14315 [Paenibacillus terrae]|uniref:Uncharacterized protein n=1 Tax=Paenibacillus terrae TaxID=159743 RepID=A0A4U2PV29_9BACL|nr:hypothetical protein [Paenibacillus terrae]TKH43463.1 hypothetical protein C1I60_14315 [Paenibacillus terrae]